MKKPRRSFGRVIRWIEAVVSEKAYTAGEMAQRSLSSLTDKVTENETEILYLLFTEA